MTEKIEDYMTGFPVIATEGMNALEALRRMRECGFRHLPVIRARRVTGIVSERDLRRAEKDPGAAKAVVSEYMTSRPYCVQAGASVLEVARQMSKHKYGSAVVVSASGKIDGIFTTTDAVDLLAQLLDQNPSLSARGMRIDDYLSFSPRREI
jgi:acetoin utilization protein AcuB